VIYLVVEDLITPTGVKGNGARNLLLGLRELEAEFTIINCQHDRQSSVDELRKQSITLEKCEIGSVFSVRLPVFRHWRDPDCTHIFQMLLTSLTDAQGIFHILEAYGYLGSWLEALSATHYQVVVTALDYHWLCNTCRLLTRHGVQCPGPKDADSCIKCTYDHTHPLKAAGLRLMLASSYLPESLTKTASTGVLKVAQQTRQKRAFEASRINFLSEDFDRVDALIAPSMALGQVFASNGFPVGKLFHVPYGTQPGRQISVEERPPLAEGVVFGFIGRLSFDKGIDILIDLLSWLRKETSTNVRLIVFSSPKATTGFEKQVMRRIESSEWISFGSFDGRYSESIDEAHQQIHFQVAPSRWTDNLPNAVLEGLERNTPVVAPQYGSFPEMIKHGVNGWLYDSIDAFKKLLVEISTNPYSAFLSLKFDNADKRRPISEAQEIREVYAKLDTV
jgi:glycosyltransferase involved in cell wall biosynthesis